MRKIHAFLLLLVVGLIWGATFPVIKVALSYTSPYIFLCLRFLIGAFVLFALFHSRILHIDRKTAIYGIIIGIALFLGYVFQTVGLIFTTASHSGLITALYIIFAPVIAIIMLKERVSYTLIVSIVMALTGLVLVTGFYKYGTFNLGDLLTTFAAVAYAFQVVLIDKFVKNNDPIALAFYQLLPVLVLSTFMIPLDSKIAFNFISVSVIIFTGVFATALAIYFQVHAQKALSSAETSLFLTSEPIFAVIFSYLLLGEALSAFGIFGAILIVISMSLALTHHQNDKTKKF